MRKFLHKRSYVDLTIIVAVVGILTYQGVVLASAGHEGEEPVAAQETVTTQIPIETASDGGTDVLGASSISWSGEILSNADVQIHPSREGQIAQWNVRLGQTVREGQVLGRLTPPPASIELASAMAERTQSLIIARAQSQATEKLVQESKNQLAVLQESLSRSRDAALALADREVLRDIQTSEGAAKELASELSVKEAAVAAAKVELEESKLLLSLKWESTRSAFERLAYGLSGKLSPYGSAPATSTQANSTTFKQFSSGIGFLDAASRNEYISALVNYLEALEYSDALPEESAVAYIEAARNLLNNSLSLSGDSSVIEALRVVLNADEAAMLTALKDYRGAEATVTVRQADLERISAEAERDLVGADTAAKNAETTVAIADSVKANKIAETNAEFARQEAELDTRISELDRELTMAHAEVRAAEAAYGVLASGASGQDITAPRAGTISAIYKNLGDHVAPETAIAGISSKDATQKFVRFNVPSDMRLPSEGDEIMVKRPGFPLEDVKARIVGVGLALDANGFYAADAEFIDPVDWPVHVSVRVVSARTGNPVLVPLSSVWWDAEGMSNVWLVMENDVIRPQAVIVGRAVGDRVEVEEGLLSGQRFVSKPTEGLKTGQSVTEVVATPSSGATEPLPEGDDGHGHSHE